MWNPIDQIVSWYERIESLVVNSQSTKEEHKEEEDIADPPLNRGWTIEEYLRYASKPTPPHKIHIIHANYPYSINVIMTPNDQRKPNTKTTKRSTPPSSSSRRSNSSNTYYDDSSPGKSHDSYSSGHDYHSDSGCDRDSSGGDY